MTRPAAQRRIAATWLRSLPKRNSMFTWKEPLPRKPWSNSASGTMISGMTLEEARSLYHYTDFTGFLLAFKAVSERLRTPEDYELITYRMLQRLAAQGVVHAEAYVSVGVVYYWRRIEFESLFYGMEKARVRAEQEFGITLYWIFDAVRHFGPEEAARVFRKAAELRRSGPASSALASAATSAGPAPSPSATCIKRLRMPAFA